MLAPGRQRSPAGFPKEAASEPALEAEHRLGKWWQRGAFRLSARLDTPFWEAEHPLGPLLGLPVLQSPAGHTRREGRHAGKLHTRQAQRDGRKTHWMDTLHRPTGRQK